MQCDSTSSHLNLDLPYQLNTLGGVYPLLAFLLQTLIFCLLSVSNDIPLKVSITPPNLWRRCGLVCCVAGCPGWIVWFLLCQQPAAPMRPPYSPKEKKKLETPGRPLPDVIATDVVHLVFCQAPSCKADLGFVFGDLGVSTPSSLALRC